MRNLRTLSILHYVYGGLVCLIGFLCLGLLGGLVGFILDHSHEPEAMEAKGIVNIIAWVVFAILELKGVLVILSGRWISRRTNRIGSMVIAGFCCLNIPLGLALGIFTFVTLSNDEVKQAYLTR